MPMDLPSPLIFAHRGASAFAPENTISAFDLAVQQQADVIELDTKLSADGKVVIIHDQTVDRTTNASGDVRDFSIAELQELDAGSFFGPQFSKERIPSLEEVLHRYSGNVWINIELTNYSSPLDALPEEVARILRKLKLIDNILVSSFHPIPLRRFHYLLPEIPLGFLARHGLSGSLSRSWLGKSILPYWALHPHFSDVSSRLVSKAHRSQKRVHVYTVNSPEEIENLISKGIDGIITDNPYLAHQILGSHKLN